MSAGTVSLVSVPSTIVMMMTGSNCRLYGFI